MTPSTLAFPCQITFGKPSIFIATEFQTDKVIYANKKKRTVEHSFSIG